MRVEQMFKKHNQKLETKKKQKLELVCWHYYYNYTLKIIIYLLFSCEYLWDHNKYVYKYK